MSLSYRYVLKKCRDVATLPARTHRPFRRNSTHVTQDPVSAPTPSGRPRVAAVVGLTLLEVIRHQDLPTEVLESENPTETMPRRLGLSDVIERQIRVYREDVKKGRKHTDAEMVDLVRLVIRRPDSEEVFFRAGRILADNDGVMEPRGPGWKKVLPGGVAFFLARRGVRRRLQRLFGRRIGGFAAGPFTLEARAHILLEGDPGGDACEFLTGLSQAIVQRNAGRQWRVAQTHCQARGDAVCRWSVLAGERSAESDVVGDMLLNPEPS